MAEDVVLAKVGTQLQQLEEDRDAWKRECLMYRSAWIRELGGKLIPKTHDIDALVVTTRDMRERLERAEGELRLHAQQAKNSLGFCNIKAVPNG